MALKIDIADKYARLSATDYAFHPSVINGIQRMMLNFVESFMFDMYLDVDDYEWLTSYLKIQRLNPKHQKFTTLSCNTKFPIPMLSLHMSRQAINSEVIVNGENILRCDDRRKIYFAICAPYSEVADPIARIGKPRVNHEAAPVIIYARDLEPFVFTRPSEKDPWTYNYEETAMVSDHLNDIFVYNGKMTLIEHGKHVNTLLKPRLVSGVEDPAGNPCRSSYRWTMNPALKDTFPIVDKDFVLRRKIEGQPGPKDVFLMVPDEEGKIKYQNKFGKPYGLDLMFQYNGKWRPENAMKAAIHTFIKGLLFMDQEIGKDNSDLVGKEATEFSTLLTFPKGIDVDMKVRQASVLLDDALHHAVSVKVLEILDGVIGDQVHIWENTAVYYKVPHRLISQVLLFVKLPESPEFLEQLSEALNSTDHLPEVLLHRAITEVIDNLNRILVELDQDMA